jgi:hypothetical protein
MKTLLTILCVIAIASVARADKPVHTVDNPIDRVECAFENVTFDWDFATGTHDFTTGTCDDQGVAVWEHGATTYVAGAPGDVWGTVLEGDYPTDSGEALVSPPFMVGDETYLMEVFHYYDAENLWDGGNVKVNGEVLTPIAGYPGIISTPEDWYAWCVDLQWGFTGLDSGWLTSCFDLSAYIGETIQVSFEFGSDDTVTEAGWYIASVKVGGDVVANDGATWTAVKGLYR